jgi:hypothetical protein
LAVRKSVPARRWGKKKRAAASALQIPCTRDDLGKKLAGVRT